MSQQRSRPGKRAPSAAAARSRGAGGAVQLGWPLARGQPRSGSVRHGGGTPAAYRWAAPGGAVQRHTPTRSPPAPPPSPPARGSWLACPPAPTGLRACMACMACMYHPRRMSGPAAAAQAAAARKASNSWQRWARTWRHVGAAHRHLHRAFGVVEDVARAAAQLQHARAALLDVPPQHGGRHILELAVPAQPQRGQAAGASRGGGQRRLAYVRGMRAVCMPRRAPACMGMNCSRSPCRRHAQARGGQEPGLHIAQAAHGRRGVGEHCRSRRRVRW